MYVWGLNNYGQLCTGDSKNRYQPELLEGGLIVGRGLGVAKDFCVASGGHHTVVCCDGEVFTCGRKEYGRLGLGKDTEEPNLPTQVEGLKGVKVVTVAAGGACSFATGGLYSWGMGTNLQTIFLSSVALGFALVLHSVIEKIKESVPGLLINVWYLDDGTLCGTEQELAIALSIVGLEGPPR